MEVPREVRAALRGLPEIGTLEPAMMLLSVAPSGSVNVCLLSRAEAWASDERLRLVVRSRRAQAALETTGRATLALVTENKAFYLELEVARRQREGDALGVECTLSGLVVDDLGIELHPLTYRVDERLPTHEAWARVAELLATFDEAP